MSNQLIEIAGIVKINRPEAILFYDGKTEKWIPKSQIEDRSNTDNWLEVTEIFIPEWLALDKGFI